MHELEEQTDKLNKVQSHCCISVKGAILPCLQSTRSACVQLVKQRNEYTFSLSSQLEAKAKEMQQRDEELQQEKATVYQMSKELEDERAQKKVRDIDVHGSRACA